jgi:serine-type D-Ala-D-Ala carboxypeptidase/endopeptidase (penicillin-binding protein 4)
MKNKVFYILILLTINLTAQNKALDSLLLNFTSNDLLSLSHVGIQLKNVSSDQKMMAYNDHKLFIPASIQKLFTSSAALSILPSNFYFETIVLFSGKFNTASNYINGDLFIKGSGDPSLESKYFKNKSFISDLSETLILREIKGFTGQLKLLHNNISTYEVNGAWLWGDIGNYYGAGVSDFTFRDNTVVVYFNSPNEIGELTAISKTYPLIDHFNIDNKVISGKTTKDLAFGFGGPNNQNRYISGEIPANKKDFKVKISMHNPEKFLTHEIRNMVDFMGEQMSQIGSLDTLLVYNSPILKELIHNINHKSNNNFTEHILMKSMFVLDSAKTLDHAASALQNYWLRTLNSNENFIMVDGCGLSRKNAISPSLMNDLLCHMYNNKNINIKNNFMMSLPVSGLTGTLKYLGDGTILQNNFYGKSGSMDGIRCYAGYFKKNNEYYSFTIMLNHLTCSSLQSFKLIEQFMIDVYEKL